MSPLQRILDSYRSSSQTEREKGGYFEELIRYEASYAARSVATNNNSLYDSYIRAIRWASDRIGGSGVIGFVTNAGWIDGRAADGLRKCLAEEFCRIHVFHLRGNQRTSGEQSRREGGKRKSCEHRLLLHAPLGVSMFV